MTVSYANDVASTSGYPLLKLLLRWRGSVYKLLWKDLLIFLVIYYMLHILYKTELSPEGKKIFEAVVVYCDKYGRVVPVSFVLGFFVSNVMNRWWNQYLSIPWPTSIAVYVSSTIQGHDEVGRAMRRTIMRYVCLSLTMVFRVLSPRVQRRFPKMSDLCEAGFLHKNELEIIEHLEEKSPGYSKNFLPIVWASGIVARARKEGRINDDIAVRAIVKALNKFRGECGMLMTYNSISIPLVYTQVVTIAVYSYFLATLMAQQYVENTKVQEAGGIDLDFIPIFIILQFIFYMGWLKVAETLMNPFGEDDDDFEVNSMIDRNLHMSYMIVDEMHNEHPELLKDNYWDSKNLPADVEDNFNEQDIIDYDVVIQQARIFRRRSTITNAIPKSGKNDTKDDVENGVKTEKSLKTPATINPALIPHASVITSKRVSNDQLQEQRILDKKMEKIRRKTISLADDDSDDEGDNGDNQN